MTYGTLSTSAGTRVVTFDRQLVHPRERVWAALTDPEQRAAWFFAGQLELTPGGAVNLVDSEFGITGTVTRVTPGELLELSWSSKDAAQSTVSFTLSDVDGGTRLVLTHTVVVGNPENLLPGWHCIVDDLPEYLDTRHVAPKPGRFSRLRDHYVSIVTDANAG